MKLLDNCINGLIRLYFTGVILMPFNQSIRRNSHVLWTISLIQDTSPTAQTKDELAEMAADVINTPQIDKVTLCKADNLQRFRFMIRDGLTEEEATAKCQEMSKQWDIDNAETLDKLKESKNLSILTWEEFQSWPEYENSIKDITSFYQSNSKFRKEIDTRIRLELNKISPDAKIIAPIQQSVLLRKYLFEELAFQKFAAFKRFDYELYKTAFPPAARHIKNNTAFVPNGLIVELYFTQFVPVLKKQIAHSNPPVGLDFPPNYENKTITHYPVECSNRSTFGSVFNKSPYQSPEARNISKTLEFIEKALNLLPEKDQAHAVETLIKFTNKEIIPLSYAENTSTLKN